MKIIGKNSLLFWMKYPIAIFTAIIVISAFWILPLMLAYMISGNFNSYVTAKSESLNFHYPFTQMVLSTENSAKGLLLAFTGIITSVCFILIITLKIINALSRDNFFTRDAVLNLKILGFGLLIFGFTDLAINIIYPQYFNINSSILYIISGFIFILLKEIFAEGKKKQDENELTI